MAGELDDMELPPGKKCGDCLSYSRCAWLFQCDPKSKRCDWSPSRFAPAKEDPTDGR
jgi:hypothetical protein